MADVYVQIEVTEGDNRLAKALNELREIDPDFPPLGGRNWWHKPPDNARGVLARCLSRHGMSGRLSVEPHDGVSASDCPPPPRWTGFTAKRRA